MNAFLFFEFGFSYWGPTLFIIFMMALSGMVMRDLGSLANEAKTAQLWSMGDGFFWFVSGTLTYQAAEHIGWSSGPFWVQMEYYVILGFLPGVIYSLVGLFDKRIPAKLEYIVGYLVAAHAFLGVFYALENS